jgi:hypothetical protein
VPPQKVAIIVPEVEPVIPDVPQVIFIGVTTLPLDLAKNQGVINDIVITFSEAMNLETVNDNTFYIRGPNNEIINGIITSDSTKKIWTFNPSKNLGFSTKYDLVITTGAKGVSGNNLIENFLWSFTTSYGTSTTSGGSSDESSSTSPEAAATPVLTTITLTPATKILNLTSNTQQLTALGFDQNSDLMVTTINYTSSNDSIATVNSTGFVNAVATGVVNITATSGAISNKSQITVVSSATECPSVSVNLGTAGDFAILAKSGISTTGATEIIGDLGISPSSATFITGFGLVLDASNEFSTSSLVTGNVYASDYFPPTPAKMTTAVSDMETAYTTTAGLADCVTELGAGEIGGMTLASGTYKWGTGLLISTDVTLIGDSDDVWVFEVAGTLGLANAKQVVLSGGAQAKNVYWVVGDVTSLGTTSVMNGNILSAAGVPVDEAIVLNTGATLNGRALSQKAVTLDANAVTKPSA